MPRLVAQSEAILGRVYQLEGKKITIGSDEECTIQIEDDSMSGHHAELILDRLDYKIKDLDSTNGTRINGERVTEQKLRRNDVVGFGNIKLRYESEHAPDVKPLPQPTAAPAFSGQASKGRPKGFANTYETTIPSKQVKTAMIEAEEEDVEIEEGEEVVVAPGEDKTPWKLILGCAGGLAGAGLLFFLYRIFS